MAASLSFYSVSMRYKTETTAEDSRFIAIVKNVSSEEEAKTFLADLKKEYSDATHICYAYIIYSEKTKRVKFKFSDDGEPAGSAGTPIFNSIKHAGLGNVCVAVVRYFGSSLLGIGPLTRAYGAATDKLVKNAPLKKVSFVEIYECVATYAEVKKIENVASEGLFKILQTEYEIDVVLTLAVDGSDYKKAVETLNKALSRKVQLKFLESRFV